MYSRRLIQFGFRLLYNELAFSYDWVSWLVSLGEWRAWQHSALRHLDPPSAGRILELAHGTGHLQIALRNAGYQSLGCDLSRAMGRIAGQRIRRVGIVPRLVRCDARRLPFASQSFAAIVCTFPSGFIVDPLTIGESYRVLLPGGKLIFVPGASLTGRSAAKRAVDLAYRVTGQSTGWPPGVLARFENAGFALTIFDAPCTISVAQVVVAEKRAG